MNVISIPSAYARAIASRGPEIVAGEIARLREVVKQAMTELRPGHPAMVPLQVAHTMDQDAGLTDVRRMDVLSDGIVKAQRLVSIESRASAILFLDVVKRDRWPSYGAYQRDLQEYVDHIVART